MIRPLKRTCVFASVLFLLLDCAAAGLPDTFVNGEKKTTVIIANGDLSVLFRDNSTSPVNLSGIQSLFNKKDAGGFDAYDPGAKGASAGMNFEHIISGHRSQSNKFTPRRGDYDLFHLPDQTSVVLVRNRKDSPWDVSSTLAYTVAEPHYVDVEFRCKIHSPGLFGERGQGMVLILMFNKTFSRDDQIRFSLFKFKVPKYPRPAWDFQYVINKIEKDREYGFRGRLVWKRFVSAQDCLKEYEKWRSESVIEEH